MNPMPFDHRLRLPLIVAPMLRVSGVELVNAVCSAGAIGSFPTANCRDRAELDHWMARMDEARRRHEDAGGIAAPYCPNLIMRRDERRLADDVDLVIAHRCELVITSVGSPASVVPRLRDAGVKVFADVATIRHAEKAIEAGVDGLVLLCAGAGGQTGWANPFAFVRATRAMFDGAIVLAGGLADGIALHAAIALGADYGYMGSRFIAVAESMGDPRYRRMIVEAEFDDIVLTRAITGLPANFLRPSLEAAGLDPRELPEHLSPELARENFGGGAGEATSGGPRRWADIWSAGHSVSGIYDIPAAAQLVDRLVEEYEGARSGRRAPARAASGVA